jgi:putative endonuclease
MQHYWVYMLRCRDGSYYTGHTDNLDARLWQHEQGLAADWTRRRRPVELVWCDAGGTRDEVVEMERRIKNWSRAKKEALIGGDWNLIGHLARPPHERDIPIPYQRPSTSLGTSELDGSRKKTQRISSPLVTSEVEGHGTEP